MSTLRLEITLVRIKKNKEKVIERSIQGSFSRVAASMLKYLILAHRKKAKIQHCSVHFIHHHRETIRSVLWEKTKYLIGKQISLHPAGFRISALIVLNILAAAWLVRANIITTNFNYNVARGETVEKVQLLNGGKPINILAMTKFNASENGDDEENLEYRDLAQRLSEIVDSQDEKCRDSKKKSECINDCLKNEEEIIAQMKEEERRAWIKYLATRPKATIAPRVSCLEKNDGDPSKSKTKGKHRDEDCCPDPDEWPRAGCVYSAKGLDLMLKGSRK